ncbi:hypothetical protein PFLUV_G00185940 [Perca fluviatilis]|uniref:C1q domain-containing protein n=1 Tax=Perca fluviatilis TaxID=8168 RepID=A0A6A5DUW4_PERFL|nr:hypothetical protein PFLUV_G00185940 [Perca fluviatilis]
MKISVSFTLLLLLGSVPASESVECQRTSPPDIYAALREMTASLVQLKADMRFLQSQGVFTAPVRGAYNFQWWVGAFGNNGWGSGSWLVKNADQLFMAYEQQAAGFMSSSKGMTLLLEVGDIVFIRLQANTAVFDDPGHHNTFSGHLLFPM